MSPSPRPRAGPSGRPNGTWRGVMLLSIAMVAVVVGVAAPACSVDRKSEQFACTTSSECSDGRSCVGGFCVDPHGNSGDDPSCNPGSKTCLYTCTSATPCDRPCPSGFTCTFMCADPTGCLDDIDCTDAEACTIHCELGACGDIRCGGADCDISCGGVGGSCGDIRCGSGRCSVTCADGACGDVSCPSSCKCDVDGCDGGRCGTMSCPVHNGTRCTSDGTGNAPCDSAAQACHSC